MCDNEKIGAYIASLRKAVGLTQAELGERLGVTGQAVSGWERGEFLPDTGILQDLALILDTSVDALLGGGSCGWRYRRRVTVEQMTEAIACIRRMRELRGVVRVENVPPQPMKVLKASGMERIVVIEERSMAHEV